MLKLTNVDAGGGWLIFGLSPSEIAVPHSAENNSGELYFMCDDVVEFVREVGKKVTIKWNSAAW